MFAVWFLLSDRVVVMIWQLKILNFSFWMVDSFLVPSFNMFQLHLSGRWFITQKNGWQKMVIQLTHAAHQNRWYWTLHYNNASPIVDDLVVKSKMDSLFLICNCLLLLITLVDQILFVSRVSTIRFNILSHSLLWSKTNRRCR